MQLEDYAIGQEGSERTFCYKMEFGSPHMGSMKGGSASKHIIYKHKNKPGWYFEDRYGSESTAWEAVRSGFVRAFELAQAGKWSEIDEIEELRGGAALRLKVLYLYFPNEILPIYSRDYLPHFLRLLQCPEGEDSNENVVRLNRALLKALRKVSSLDGWSTAEMARFLFWWSNPRQKQRIVKIAPGEEARYWGECLAGGYICVGWEDVGDLRAFDSKESFRARFEEDFAGSPHKTAAKLTKKSNELWTLIELEPGDIVVANRGISHILAIGTVVEPGYEWRPDRTEYQHTVRVKWDTSYEQDIPPRKR